MTGCSCASYEMMFHPSVCVNEPFLNVKDCNTVAFPLSFLSDFVVNLEKTIVSMSNLRESMNAATNLTAICGGKDFGSIYGYFTLLTNDYIEFAANATNTMELLKCQQINPMYKELVHEVACTDVPEAAIWAFGTLLVISFFSMVMITLRASWLDVIKNDVPASLEVTQPQDIWAEKRRHSNLSSEIFNDSPRSNYRESDEDDEDLNRELERLESDNDSQLDRQYSSNKAK